MFLAVLVGIGSVAGAIALVVHIVRLSPEA